MCVGGCGWVGAHSCGLGGVFWGPAGRGLFFLWVPVGVGGGARASWVCFVPVTCACDCLEVVGVREACSGTCVNEQHLHA